MTVVHIGAGLDQVIVVGQAGAHIDRDPRLGQPVKDGGRLREAVEVDGVRVEQVGPHQHTDVGQGEVELLALINDDGRCRKISRFFQI